MRSAQRGFTLIEILVVMLIASMVLLGTSAMIDTSLEDTKAEQAASYQGVVAAAAAQYLAANYTTLADDANVGVTRAVTFQDLRDANLLPTGMRGTNGYGQAPCLLVRARTKASGTSTVNVLDALVVTEGAPAHDGVPAQAIPVRVLAFAAANAGQGGGYISPRTPTVARGTSGAWELDAAALGPFTSQNCSGNTAGAGSLVSAIFFDGPGKAEDFLYRNAVPGLPELNRMNTPLGMGGDAVVTLGAACTEAAIAVDDQRNLMFCNSAGAWQRVNKTSWRDPVASFAALPTPASDPTDAPVLGDVRMTTDTGRAFTYMGPTQNWVALAVDQNGDMNVPRDVIAKRDVNVTRDLNSGRNVVADSEGGGVYTQSVSVWSQHVAGEACHIPYFDTEVNKVQHEWPIGTIVMDTTLPRPRPLVCSGSGEGDAYMVYFDGSVAAAGE
jgi:prepilin-type N-terminal cleavage/methylation domain-containing protein